MKLMQKKNNMTFRIINQICTMFGALIIEFLAKNNKESQRYSRRQAAEFQEFILR